MLLSLLHKLTKADKEVKSLIWDRNGNTGNELRGKTIGIIGYGNTGSAFAKCLSGFGVKVLAYDKYRKNYSDTFAQEASLEMIYEQADIVSFHVPLTLETKYYFNDVFVAQMKKPFILLNLSRGEVVQTSAIIDALEKNKMTSAGLDVLENEKIENLSNEQKVLFEKLIQYPNVMLSPHVGGWSQQSYENIAKLLLRKIKELTPMLAHS
jgi:D-3-phosphoglycerate dehydrogenase